MPITASSINQNFELAPTGNQLAVCVFVEDIGLQNISFQGQDKIVHQIVICWELEEKMTNGKPFMLSKTYTLSLSDKANLRKDLQSWRGVPFTTEELVSFDVEKMKGQNCLLNIVQEIKPDGREFRKIAAISPIMKNMTKITPVNEVPPKWIDEKRKEQIEPQPKIEDAGDYLPFK